VCVCVFELSVNELFLFCTNEKTGPWLLSNSYYTGPWSQYRTLPVSLEVRGASLNADLSVVADIQTRTLKSEMEKIFM
jgi:hypothetical protein